MATYSVEERSVLLNAARAAILASLEAGELATDAAESFPALQEDRGCFVTLHKRGELRGCIGTIEPVAPLITGVINNARNAAFRDPRFPAVTAHEMSAITVEVSVLSVPRDLAFSDGEDLKNKLIPGVHGVILSREGRSATFLPQVWEQLSDKEAFLTHLCLKAGLPGAAWQDSKTRVKVYEAEHFTE